MQTKTEQEIIENAIQQSVSHTETAKIDSADPEEAMEIIEDIAGVSSFDFAKMDGWYDVWGTYDGDDFRIQIHPKETTICGHQIQIDNSGQGHNWRNIDADEIKADVREEIEGEIIDGGKDDVDCFVGSNGLHYRW